MRAFVPQFDYEWTMPNALVWGFYCLPSALLAVGMALFIPRLQSLTGLLNSFACVTLQVTAVPLLLYYTSNTDVRHLVTTEGGPCSLTFLVAFVYGLFFSAVLFAPVAYAIPTTVYTPGPGQTFWCDVVG